MGGVAPSFPGSLKLSAYPFPYISFRRIGEPEVFSSPDDSYGLTLFDWDGFRAGPVANFVFKRGEGNGLFGLRRVGLTHEVGGFLEASPTEYLRARAELRQGVDGHRGFVAALGMDLHNPVGPFSISAGPRLSFGDNRYANAYFSVTPFEAAVNGRLTPYSAAGGFTAAGGVATIRYDFNEETNAALFGGMQRLLGSVGASPIPNRIGSRNQFSAGLSITRSFEIHDFW
jgi:outer membrane protein